MIALGRNYLLTALTCCVSGCKVIELVLFDFSPCSLILYTPVNCPLSTPNLIINIITTKHCISLYTIKQAHAGISNLNLKLDYVVDIGSYITGVLNVDGWIARCKQSSDLGCGPM